MLEMYSKTAVRRKARVTNHTVLLINDALSSLCVADSAEGFIVGLRVHGNGVRGPVKTFLEDVDVRAR